MRTIFNKSGLFRFKKVVALNLVGLTIGFAAFIVIMQQVMWERNFDTYYPEHENLFRVAAYWSPEEYAVRSLDNIASLSVPHLFVRTVQNVSPHIVSVGIKSRTHRSNTFTVMGEKEFTEPFCDATRDFIHTLGLEMVEGNSHSIQDPDKVLIPLSTARKLFGNEPAVGQQLIGKTNRSYIVGGVYRDAPSNTTVPNVIYQIMDDNNDLYWGNFNYPCYIRLDDARNVKQVEQTINQSVTAASGRSNDRFMLIPVKDQYFKFKSSKYSPEPRGNLTMNHSLLAIAGIIILLCIINFNNLLGALAPKRIKSLSIRRLYGEGKWSIRLSFIAEAVAVALMGFLLSLLLIGLLSTNQSLNALLYTPIGLTDEMWRLIGLTAGISVMVGVLSSVFSAWFQTSIPFDMALKVAFVHSPLSRRVRSVLVGIQFVAAFVLILISAFIHWQNRYMVERPLGYERDGLVMMMQGFWNSDNPLDKAAFEAKLREREVRFESISYSAEQLMEWQQGWGRMYNDSMISIKGMRSCTPNFLSTLGTPIIEGRGFTDEDINTQNAIVNETAQRKYGFKIGEPMFDGWVLIGVCKDIVFASSRDEIEPMLIGCHVSNNQGSACIRLSAGENEEKVALVVKEVMTELYPNHTQEISTMKQKLVNLYGKEQRVGILSTLFSLIAIIIALVGVFGLVMFESEGKRKEIGIRKVFGATVANILMMFNRHYIRVVLACFVIAIPIAWYAVSLWLEQFAYRTPLHWWIFAVALVLVLAVVIFTVTTQSWRAAHTNPVDVMQK